MFFFLSKYKKIYKIKHAQLYVALTYNILLDLEIMSYDDATPIARQHNFYNVLINITMKFT